MCVCVGEVNRHLASEQSRAAVKIQAQWKGYRTRHGIIANRRQQVLRVHAATVIQRTVIIIMLIIIIITTTLFVVLSS